MYNSSNLPLSKKKIIKKSFGVTLLFLLVSLIVGGGIFLATWSTDAQWFIALLYAIGASLFFDLIFIGSTLLYQYFYYRFYYYNFEEDKAEIKKGVISVATGHVRYNKIQNIYVDQDILDRLFGLFDVHYETAGESSGFYSHVDGLNKQNADALVTFLNQKVLNKDTNSGSSPTLDKVITQKVEDTDSRVMTRENVPLKSRVIVSIMFSTLGRYALIILGILISMFTEEDSSLLLSNSFALLISVIVIIGVYIYAKIWFKNFYFKFDKEGGEITSKVIATSNTHVYYNRIQNIDVSQSVLDRLLGLYRVVIETAADGKKTKPIKIYGIDKDKAEILKDFLLDKSRKYQSV